MVATLPPSWSLGKANPCSDFSWICSLLKGFLIMCFYTEKKEKNYLMIVKAFVPKYSHNWKYIYTISSGTAAVLEHLQPGDLGLPGEGGPGARPVLRPGGGGRRHEAGRGGRAARRGTDRTPETYCQWVLRRRVSLRAWRLQLPAAGNYTCHNVF